MTVTQRLDQHDKQIRDLMKEGIKMVVETRRLALETRKDLRELAAQKRTDASLHALIDSMRVGGGHTTRRVD